jgi:hypothetical protein
MHSFVRKSRYTRARVVEGMDEASEGQMIEVERCEFGAAKVVKLKEWIWTERATLGLTLRSCARGPALTTFGPQERASFNINRRHSQTPRSSLTAFDYEHVFQRYSSKTNFDVTDTAFGT